MSRPKSSGRLSSAAISTADCRAMVGRRACSEESRRYRSGARCAWAAAGGSHGWVAGGRCRQAAAGAGVVDDLVATDDVQVEQGQVGREDPQQLLVIARQQAVVQPEGAGAARCVEALEVDGVNCEADCWARMSSSCRLAVGSSSMLQCARSPACTEGRQSRVSSRLTLRPMAILSRRTGEVPSWVSGGIIAKHRPAEYDKGGHMAASSAGLPVIYLQSSPRSRAMAR